jgi:hypothetical protein
VRQAQVASEEEDEDEDEVEDMNDRKGKRRITQRTSLERKKTTTTPPTTPPVAQTTAALPSPPSSPPGAEAAWPPAPPPKPAAAAPLFSFLADIMARAEHEQPPDQPHKREAEAAEEDQLFDFL